MAVGWETVQVFISSTFSEMHAARDYLVKVVFPLLREKLEKFRIHLVDIDLRWGVTKEQSDGDRALDLCLQQIDECRPLFIGILGDRYGYVPEDFPEDALSKYGWIQDKTGKSITELEIIHGVLNDHEMKPRSFFCFRDNAFIEDVPEAKRGDMQSDSDASADKLKELKQTIIDADVPLLEDYPCNYSGLKINWRIAQQKLQDETDQRTLHKIASDGIVDSEEYSSLNEHLQKFVNEHGVVYLDGLKKFGDAIAQFLEQAILNPEPGSDLEKHLRELEQPQNDPLGLAEESEYHEQFMESRLRVYVGREPIQRALVKFAESDHTVPCLVTGPSGMGKSAVMSNFVRGYRKLHENEKLLLIPHFIGASPNSTLLRQMLRRFCLELQREFGFEEEVPQETTQLGTTFRDFIERVPENRAVLFVIDALNQLDETDNAHAMNWLPWKLPAHVKFVTSCIDDPDREEAVLQALKHRPRGEYEVKPLKSKERFEIVHQVPKLSAKMLDSLQVGLLLTNPTTSNPLFLLVALEELRGFGSFDELDICIAMLPRPDEKKEPAWKQLIKDSQVAANKIGDEKKRNEKLQRLERIKESLEQIEKRVKQKPPVVDTVTALFTQVIERLEIEFDPVIVRTVLELLAVARHGLSRSELLAMTEGDDVAIDESTSDLFSVLNQLRPYLQPRGEYIDFFHRGLYKAVREKYLASEKQQFAAHRQLADNFHRQLNPVGAEPWSGDSVRSLSELPFHQTKGHCWDELEATLTSIQFLEEKNEAGNVFELVVDFTTAIEQIPEELIWAGPTKREEKQQRPSEGYTTKKNLTTVRRIAPPRHSLYCPPC